MGGCLVPFHPLSLSVSRSRMPKTRIKNWQSKSLIPSCRAELSNRRSFLLSLPLSFSAFLLLGSNNSGRGSLYAFSVTEKTEYEYDLVSPSERDASALISDRVSEAVDLLEKGKEFQAQGDFNAALSFFSQVIESYKDFAFSDYARVGRALALYEVGDREEAIAEMEDVSISLKGYPEVHAALAAALYTDKHAPLLAENQFAIATVLDPHFTDLSYVRDIKHWPPSLVTSLEHFIKLS